MTPPQTQIALLRGVNVGRAKRIAMADLRALLTRLGYLKVRTLLNSGNIVFADPAGDPVAAASRIEAAIPQHLGTFSRVTVLSAAELATVVAENPLAGLADDFSRLLVAILARSFDQSPLLPLTRQDWSPDTLALGTRAAYLWCAGGILESRLVVAVNQTLKDNATTRNWATILKLHGLAGDL